MKLLIITHVDHFDPNFHTHHASAEAVMAFCDKVIAMAQQSQTTQDIVLYPLIAEPFILRLLRRVREGSLLPKQIELYNPEMKLAHITKDGDLSYQWPNGFYTWRTDELF
jgi:hypothetical protein